jgi:hypothetical protein
MNKLFTGRRRSWNYHTIRMGSERSSTLVYFISQAHLSLFTGLIHTDTVCLYKEDREKGRNAIHAEYDEYQISTYIP